MKAVLYNRYGGPEVLDYTDVEDPVPADDEALIAVRCASVIPGDWKVRSGFLQEMFPIDLPTIPGRDGAGVVVATGPDCNWAEIGDELCFVTEHVEPGSYAELVARPREMAVAKPANIDFAEAAAMMHAGVCAWIGLIETARIEAGQNVLIHAGAGAIGGMAIQIARHVGCHVTATCSSANTVYVQNLGADRAIAYDREQFTDLLSDQDVVFDLVGGPVHEQSCRVLKPGGILVWLIATPFEDVSNRYGVDCRQAVIHDRRETLERVAALVSDGILSPQVSRRLPLSQAADAHRALERGENSRGRIILEIGEQS
jgi:NADPH:quinone reductase-like Zn-dependent oxidoreductase